MIAREDKGVVGGVDYNRSPTVYFQTKGDEGNMTKVPESDIKGSAIGGFERIQKYCNRINKTSTDPFNKESSNNYYNSFLGGSKIVSTILQQISRRLNSLEELFFVSICLSRYGKDFHSKYDFNRLYEHVNHSLVIILNKIVS